MTTAGKKAYIFMKQKKGASSKQQPVKTPSWEGVIGFGSVQIPIAMYAATDEKRSNLVRLDKRDLKPVGNNQYNKSTLKIVQKDDVVSGIELSDGRCIPVMPADIASLLPRTSHLIDIECCVHSGEVPVSHYLRSYHLLPTNGAAKPYALLMDALAATRMVGLARIVVSTRQYIALIKPEGRGLILHLLRWSSEVRPFVGAVEVPIAEQELALAKRLVRAMAKPWDVSSWNDAQYSTKLSAMAEMKATAAGQPVKPLPGEEMPVQPQGLDLNGLLKASIKALAPIKQKAAATPVPKAVKPKKASVLPKAKTSNGV
jgi:DNA end-binding protein Ku